MAYVWGVAWKTLRRDPGFALTAIAILAIAAGACTSMFSVTLNGERHTIVGVASADLIFPEDSDVWTLMKPFPPNYYRRNALLQVIGRLKGGVSLAHAGSEMQGIAKALEQEYPATNSNWGVTLTPLENCIAGDVGLATAILFGAVILVLLIACANVANLLLNPRTCSQCGLSAPRTTPPPSSKHSWSASRSCRA
jgi:hypothetical protein